MSKREFIKKSIFAGIFIGLAGFVYLSCQNKIVGAILFAIGLCCVVLYKLNLFTGKAGVVQLKQLKTMGNMFILNFVGCMFAALIAQYKIDVIGESLELIIASRKNMGLLPLFALGTGTGIIMEAAVNHSGREEKTNWLPLLFGVPTFIICGMPHSVADSFYYCLHCLTNFDGFWFLLPLFITVLGNFVGCNVPRFFMWFGKPKDL